MSEASPPPMASSPETSPQKTDPAPPLDNLNTSTNPTSEQTPPPSSSPPPPPEEPPPPPPLPTPPPPEQSPPPNPTPPPPASSPPPNPTPTPPPPDASPPPPSTPPPSETPVLSSQAPPPPPAATTPPPPPPSSVPASPPPPPVVGSPPEVPVAISPPPPAANNGSQTPAPLPPVHNPRSPTADGSGIQGGSMTSSSSSSPDTTIQGVMIAGIAVGAVIVIVLSIVIGFLIFLRKRKKPQGPQYYMDPGHGRPPKGGEQYYNDPTQWHSPRPMDQNMQLPPPPGYMGGPWGGPPAGNNSSDMSSGYSGQHPTPMQPPSSTSMGGITHFGYDELAAATNGFSQANLLGQGGFGFVHKGVLITSQDRREVAVKSLKSGSGQGEREFQAEVEIISRVHHRHLVSLVGYCIANQQRLLVYEYVPNKTLEFHLHGKGQPVMDWATRLRIAVGSAKGLAYLHEDCMPRIIHRDIKAANILLDNNFEAMVADFGLAKLTSDNFTHVSTRVMGTFGYLAPEYASSGKLTEKSDVFSYGVMLLELITGRRPVDTTNRFMEDSLVDWARPLLTKALEDGNYEQLVDPRLEGKYNPHEMTRMLTSAAATIRHSARRRPKMSQIVRALEGDSSLEDLNEGVKPGQSAIYNPNGGTDIYDTRAYNADMLKFKKMVMSSQDFNSSEYGGTNEFGLDPSASSSSGSLQRD